MEQTSQEPFYPNEASIFRQYVIRLGTIINHPCEVYGKTAWDEHGDASQAWRIVLTPSKNPHKEHIVGVFDWDDSLEGYTERKERFYDALAQLVPDKQNIEQSQFIAACRALNKASRILPSNGTHPEHYAPQIELLALTSLLQMTKDGNFPAIISEDDARVFLQTNVLPNLSDKVSIQEKTKNGSSKAYFKEVKNQSIALNPDEKPSNVADNVWLLFKHHMTASNIPVDEMKNFDLTNDIRFVVATFGEGSFQLEKLTNAIAELKRNGARIPDEIIIFLRGRKEPILTKLLQRYPQASFVYVDDSPRQVNALQNNERIHPIHAIREGSKRSSEEAHPSIPVVDMTKTSLLEIIQKFSS